MDRRLDAQTRENLQHLSANEKRELLARLLQQRLERQSSYPLSHGQRGLWFLNHLDPAGVACNIHFASRIHSPIELGPFRRALQHVVESHPSLRATFQYQDGNLCQRVHPEMSLSFEMHDAATWSEATLRARLDEEIHRPFDLESGPLFRTFLFRTGTEEAVFLATSHHLVLDFWSVVILWKDVRAAYVAEVEGRAAFRVPPQQATYADFVRWQDQRLQGEGAEELERYWFDALNDAPPILELPTDFPRPAVFSHTAGSVPFSIPPETTRRLLELASLEKVTLFTTLLATLQFVLGRHVGEEKFLVGSPFSGRSHPDFAQTVGCFINLLPLRADLSGNPTFRQLLRRVSTVVWEALQNQDYPFHLMVERREVTRDLSRHPLVQVAFTLEQSQLSPEENPGGFLFSQAMSDSDSNRLPQTPIYVEQRTCQMDLEWVLERAGEGLSGILRYCAALFHRESAERIVQRYQTLLEQASRRPDVPLTELAWYPDEERQLVVEKWNQTRAEFPTNTCLHDFFHQQSRACPQAVALRTPNGTVSYQELDEFASAFAKRLHASELESGDLVGLCFEPCPKMIAAILAALKVGAAYVPLDPRAPMERLRQISEDAKLTAIMAPAELADRIPPELVRIIPDDGDPPALSMESANGSVATGDVSPNDLAYVIYTSGSTGRPKGVAVEHRAICNTIHWRQRDLPLSESDRCLWIVPYYFDPSIAILFHAFAAGASLVLVAPGEEVHPPRLLNRLIQEQVTALFATPKMVELLLQDPMASDCTHIRTVFCGGEAPAAGLPRRVREVWNASFVNLYGPTETAVEATWWSSEEASEHPNLPIGRPIANMRAYVLDRQRRPLPVGVPGELYLEGAGLARGYLHDPQLTQERFLTGEFLFTTGGRVYRTGDRVRWLGDGNLEFLGRMDDQFKLRGYRLEPKEIELALEQHAGVREAAVFLRDATVGAERLDAAVVPRNGGGAGFEQHVIRKLRERVPSYMVPDRVWCVAELPHTNTGKLDRRRLPQLLGNVADEPRFVRQWHPPRTPLESALSELWCEVIGLERVGRSDNFYELGGTSLQGALFISRLQRDLEEQLPLVTIFELPTVAELARFLAKAFPEKIASRFGLESVEMAQSELEANSSTPSDSEGGPRRPDDVKVMDRDVLVPLQSQGGQTPLYLIHPPGGIVACYQALAQCLGEERPIFGIRGRGLQRHETLPARLEVMASDYCAAITSHQPSGSYLLAGWSLGGIIALEMAGQLRSQGRDIGFLGFLDTTIPHGEVNKAYRMDAESSGAEYGFDVSLEELAELPPDEQLPYLWEHVQRMGLIDHDAPTDMIEQLLHDIKRVFHHHVHLASEYAIRPYPGTITLFRPRDVPAEVLRCRDRGWGRIAAEVAVHWVPGRHHTMVKPPHVEHLAEALRRCLLECERVQ